jgi:hypothetical protein
MRFYNIRCPLFLQIAWNYHRRFLEHVYDLTENTMKCFFNSPWTKFYSLDIAGLLEWWFCPLQGFYLDSKTECPNLIHNLYDVSQLVTT